MTHPEAAHYVYVHQTAASAQVVWMDMVGRAVAVVLTQLESRLLHPSLRAEQRIRVPQVGAS